MISHVIQISGKSGSGKDLYSYALSNVLEDIHEVTPPVLAFGGALKRLGSDLSYLPIGAFHERDRKDAPAMTFYASTVHDTVSWAKNDSEELGKEVDIYDSSVPGCPSFPVNVRTGAFYGWFCKHKDTLTPRDILKKLGSDGGIVPSWTWVIAVRTQLEYLHAKPGHYVAIISDTRRLEELYHVRAWCETRGIPEVHYRLTPWNTNITGSSHITETELEGRPHLCSKVFHPKAGMISMIETLREMLYRLSPTQLMTDEAVGSISTDAFLRRALERSRATLV